MSFEAPLAEYVAAALESWPNLEVDETELARFVYERCSGGVLPPLAHAPDMLLAFACARGMPAAINAFHRVYGPVIERVVLHRKAEPHVADDARQILERHLLVREDKSVHPKIADYRGLGSLKSWVASSAARLLSDLRRSSSRKREVAEVPSGVVLGAELDPELEYLRTRYQGEVEQAIVSALAELSSRDRAQLRLHLAEQMTIDKLGALYAVNRATAARWLAAARQALVAGARSKLRERLQISESQCESLVALMNSRLHVSLVRHLTETPESM